MKKLIQLLSFLSLVVVFSAVSAKAQMVRKYQAQIPHDFNIGQKAYQAGNYVIKVSKNSNGLISFSLADANENKLQTILLRENGNIAENEPVLQFTTYAKQRFLTGMVMQEMGFSIFVSEKDRQMVKAQGKPETESDREIVIAAK